MVTPETLTNRSGRQRQRGCYLGCDSSSASSSLSWSAVGTDVEPDAGGGRTKEIAFRLLGRELFERVRRVSLLVFQSLTRVSRQESFNVYDVLQVNFNIIYKLP